MTYMNKTDHLELTFPKRRPDPNESMRLECGRLIHAAVISRRFQAMLLTNPIKTIEEGYCGEKFAFTHDEKQRIQLIRASNLSDFSSQLMCAIERSPSMAASTPEMAFVR